MGRALSQSGWRRWALVWAVALAWLPSAAAAASRAGDFAALDAPDEVHGLASATPLRVSLMAARTYRPIARDDATFGAPIPPAAGHGWSEDATLVRFELTAKRKLGGHMLAATIGGIDLGKASAPPSAPSTPSGLAGFRQPLPLASDVIDYVQPRYGHPLLDFAPGAFRRPGFFGKLAWTAPLPIRAEAIHFDSNGDLQAAGGSGEWGRRTSFDALGAVAELGQGWELRAQALAGRTRLGKRTGGRDWIDMRFRAAYGMVARRFARTTLSTRLDLYRTRNAGSADIADDEAGWALTLAAQRKLGPQLTAQVEVLHAESDGQARARPARVFAGTRSQVMMALRAHW